MPQTPETAGKESNEAILGFEASVGRATNALRGSMDPADYKQLVLCLAPRTSPTPSGSSTPSSSRTRRAGPIPRTRCRSGARNGRLRGAAA